MEEFAAEALFIHATAVEGQPAVKLVPMDARLIPEHTILVNLPPHQTVLIAALQLLFVRPVTVYKLLVDILADREVSAAGPNQLLHLLPHARLRPVITVPIAHVMRETLLQPAAADPYICNVARKLQLLPHVQEVARQVHLIAVLALTDRIIQREIAIVIALQTAVTLIAAMLLQPNARKVQRNALIPAHILNA